MPAQKHVKAGNVVSEFPEWEYKPLAILGLTLRLGINAIFLPPQITIQSNDRI
jgi:hypothetical protein